VVGNDDNSTSEEGEAIYMCVRSIGTRVSQHQILCDICYSKTIRP